MSRATENKEEILKIHGCIDLINQRIDTIENNHLKHIQSSIARIQWIMTAVGSVSYTHLTLPTTPYV